MENDGIQQEIYEMFIAYCQQLFPFHSVVPWYVFSQTKASCVLANGFLLLSVSFHLLLGLHLVRSLSSFFFGVGVAAVKPKQTTFLFLLQAGKGEGCWVERQVLAQRCDPPYKGI
jgi:hypothetical protein